MPVLAGHEGQVPVSGQDSFWQDLVDVDASLPLDVSAHFASLRRGRSLLAAGCRPIKPSSSSIRLPAYQGIHRGAIALNADAVDDDAQAAEMAEMMAKALRQWVSLIDALADNDQPCIYRCFGAECDADITLVLKVDNTGSLNRWASDPFLHVPVSCLFVPRKRPDLHEAWSNCEA